MREPGAARTVAGMRLNAGTLTDEHAAGHARRLISELGGRCDSEPYPSCGSWVYPGELDGQPIVVKVEPAADPARLTTLLHWAAHAGPPVLAPTHTRLAGSGVQLSVWPRGDGRDLYDQVTWAQLGTLLGQLTHTPAPPVAVFDQTVGLDSKLAELDGTRFQSLVELAAPLTGPLIDRYRTAAAGELHTTCHGDPHPGQVVDTTAGVRLIDLDRAGYGPSLSDLGRAWCWQACGHLPVPVWRHLLERYLDCVVADVARGDDIDRLARRVEPFGELHLLRQALTLAVTELRGERAPRLDDTRHALSLLRR